MQHLIYVIDVNMKGVDEAFVGWCLLTGHAADVAR